MDGNNINTMECTVCGIKIKHHVNKKYCDVCRKEANNAGKKRFLELPQNIIRKRKDAKRRRSEPGFTEKMKLSRQKLVRRRKTQKAYYRLNREKYLERQKKYNKANKDEINAKIKQKKRRDKHFKGE